ncbi:MAG: YdbL family protein [Planctomycetota bacterium]|nr:YdbL family protein [Planctomycetota bacterium]
MNSNRIHIITVALAALLLTALCAPSYADTAQDALKKRAEERYPKLRAAKDAGKIGEDSGGMIEAVDPKFLQDSDLAKLVNDENNDRTELYRLIAQASQTTPDLVAQEAAKRNFANAKSGDYLKGPDGAWQRKP